MSYYQGDFYRGDYYRGDPGFWSIVKGMAGSAAGMIPGVGGIIGKVTGAIGGGRIKLPGPIGMRVPGVPGSGVLSRVKQVGLKHPVLTGAAAAGAVGIVGAGMHIARSGKHAGEAVRNRRMRVTNPKALRRAIRRAQGFAKLASRVLRFTTPKHRGRPYFKRVGRKRR